MNREKKTVPEQLGQIALGFAGIVSRMEKDKSNSKDKKGNTEDRLENNLQKS